MAREFVCSVAEEAYDDAGLTDSLRLVVSEVVTNSIRHGQAGADGCVEVKVKASRERLRLEIVDDGPGFYPDARRGRADEPGGWGLFLVDQCAVRWGNERGERHRVWLELERRDAA